MITTTRLSTEKSFAALRDEAMINDGNSKKHGYNFEFVNGKNMIYILHIRRMWISQKNLAAVSVEVVEHPVIESAIISVFLRRVMTASTVPYTSSTYTP